MTTTPDGISFSDLQDLMEAAPKEDHDPKSESAERERLEKIAEAALDMAAEKAKGPMVHKIMICMILSNMISWHTRVGEKMFDEGEIESGTAWLRDAGKCQAMMDLIFQIECGDDDFLVPADR